ncbi:enoyl-CoA delta isomerase 2, peroxisomal-like [Oryza brachyantha]|uniref:enoyl-CoA delta isomerase 2, peroxisomal-like n=1 Tax=Oryza brachyantha TaxID=4533 RepID=UPI001ADC97FF|nr:enoyl-CoA delta isomerase 2, peroxisomal-like [Oryza brachyantha]
MVFCTLQPSPIKDILVLTMASSDGHQYLTDDAITELIGSLRTARDTPGLRGLVTTSRLGSFCDGLDDGAGAGRLPDREQAARLAARVGEAVRLLLEVPAPTAAAVSGDATSLGLALALAHDHCVVWEGAAVGLPEAARGRPLPGYVAALLRDKIAYARLRKLLMLRAEACTGRELVGTWYSANDPAVADREVVAAEACELLEGIDVGDGKNYAEARQAMWPESCAAVGIDITLPRPPSREEILHKEKEREKHGVSDLHRNNKNAKSMQINMCKTS